MALWTNFAVPEAWGEKEASPKPYWGEGRRKNGECRKEAQGEREIG
jgi:hypothetical protein